MTGRPLTAAVDTELGQSTTAPRYLVEILFDSGPLRLWTGIGDLPALGNTFTGTGRLGHIDPIEETQEIVASGIQMALVVLPTTDQPDAVDEILDIALTEEYQGRSITVWQAQINHTTDPPSLIDDPFIRFKGYMDIMEDTELPGAAVIIITAENRLVDFERSQRDTYTPESQREKHPGDTFFDHVAALQTMEIQL